ncbi:sterol desaturase family protein, partial [Enterococcus faecalis]|uniref:sterol desaturase family protein n=1 Tax=Enterococcus faecalis TaxID=1351 RepID=UPI00403FAFE3
TRCNYANCLILWDRVFGTFHDGEAELVGQIETGGTHQRYLSIREVMLYPIAPLFKPLRGVLPPA